MTVQLVIYTVSGKKDLHLSLNNFNLVLDTNAPSLGFIYKP